MVVQATLKKSLFPVQRVAEIVASQVAAILFFFPNIFFFLGKKMMNLFTKKNGKMKKKSFHSAVMNSPTRWTGNNIFFKGGLTIDLRTMACMIKVCCERHLGFFKGHAPDKRALQKEENATTKGEKEIGKKGGKIERRLNNLVFQRDIPMCMLNLGSIYLQWSLYIYPL